jgi:hypothetical protein
MLKSDSVERKGYDIMRVDKVRVQEWADLHRVGISEEALKRRGRHGARLGSRASTAA